MVQGIGSNYGSTYGCGYPQQNNPLELAQGILLTEMQLFMQMAMLDGFMPGGCQGAQGAQGPQGVQSCQNGQVGPAGGMNTQQACEVLKKHFDTVATGKFKSIDEDSLKNVLASDTAPAELKLAANTLLNNPTALGQISGAHEDGLAKGITMGDLNTVTSPGNTTLNGIDAQSIDNLQPGSKEQAASILLKHFDSAASGKFKTIDKESLEKLVASDSAPAELKWAANQFLNNPSWLGEAAGASQDGPFFGGDRISRGDLNTLLSPGFQG